MKEYIVETQNDMSDGQIMLKYKRDLVRCKDCRDYLDIKCPCYELDKDDDWFCADGERRDDDA